MIEVDVVMLVMVDIDMGTILQVYSTRSSRCRTS